MFILGTEFKSSASGAVSLPAVWLVYFNYRFSFANDCKSSLGVLNNPFFVDNTRAFITVLLMPSDHLHRLFLNSLPCTIFFSKSPSI